MFPTQIGRRQPGLLLFDHPDDLRFGETAFSHVVCSFRLGRLYITARELPGGRSFGQGTWAAGSGWRLLSGKTLGGLRAVLTEWPGVSAPMAEAMIEVSRAAVQRSLKWMKARGLIREMTRQRRLCIRRVIAQT